MALTRLVICTPDDEVLFSGISERARPVPVESGVVPLRRDEDDKTTVEAISGVYRVDRGEGRLAAPRVPTFDDEDEDTGDYEAPRTGAG